MTGDDGGLASIFFVVSMVGLLGVMSLAIDGGAIFHNKQSDQNGADSAAMAIALACANGGTCATSAGSGAVNPAGSTPARTGQTLSASIGSGTVTATVTKVVATAFGQAIGVTSGTTSRSATAKWQQLASGLIFPFTFSSCAFGGHTAVGSHVLLYAQGVPGCTSQSSNSKGFVNDGCVIRRIGGTLTDANGNSFIGTGCASANLDDYVGRDVLLPVWTVASGNLYTISTIVRFRLLGWSANGGLVGGEMTARCTVPGLTPAVTGNDTNPCASGIVEAYGATEGGTTGQACLGSTLSACFVFLDH